MLGKSKIGRRKTMTEGSLTSKDKTNKYGMGKPVCFKEDYHRAESRPSLYTMMMVMEKK